MKEGGGEKRPIPSLNRPKEIAPNRDATLSKKSNQLTGGDVQNSGRTSYRLEGSGVGGRIRMGREEDRRDGERGREGGGAGEGGGRRGRGGREGVGEERGG